MCSCDSLSRSWRAFANAPPSPVHPAAVRVNVPAAFRLRMRPRSGRALKRLRMQPFLRCPGAHSKRGIFPKPHRYICTIGVSDLRKQCVTLNFPLARKSALRGVFFFWRALQSQSLRKQSARSSVSDFPIGHAMPRCSICFPIVVVIVANGRHCSLRRMRGAVSLCADCA